MPRGTVMLEAMTAFLAVILLFVLIWLVLD
jgi:hypothetical protein